MSFSRKPTINEALFEINRKSGYGDMNDFVVKRSIDRFKKMKQQNDKDQANSGRPNQFTAQRLSDEKLFITNQKKFERNVEA